MNSNNPIWIEKYRPSSLDDVVGNKSAVKELKGILRTGVMTHLLLSGPPGVGKTSALLCLARSLLGEHFSNAVLELNASDDRGIDVVRDKIKNFARKKLELPPGRTKIIILDEADSMTDAAQQALRRLMEIYSATTRFALACNQSNKVIEPLQSRCAMIRFTRITNDEMAEALKRICSAEGIPCADDALKVVAEAAEGDLRRAVGTIQTASVTLKNISLPSIYKACDVPPTEQIDKIIKSCLTGSWRDSHTAAFSLITDGFNTTEIMKSVLNSIQSMPQLDDKKKMAAVKEMIRLLAFPTTEHPSMMQMDKGLVHLCMVLGREY